MKKPLIFLFTLFTCSLIAQNNSNNFYKKVNSYLFNGDWVKSDSLIEAELGEQQNLLKYNLFKAYNHFYTRYFGTNQPYSRDETIRQVKQHAWDAIKYGEGLDESLENNFYLGSAYAYLSRVNIMNRELWEGYWNASKAENYLEDVLDEDPNFVDAYLNLGVNEYFPAATITGFQSVLAWLGGMAGDRDAGIFYIEKVSDNGKFYKDEANYILGLIQTFRENNTSVGYEYWKILNEKYPDNRFFDAQLNRAYFSTLVDEKGVGFLEDEFDSLETKYSVDNPGVLNNLGYNLINQERFDEALVVFKVNIKKYPEVANGYDSLGECFMTMGDNENAIKYYKIAFEKLPADTTINDDFRQRLEEGIRDRINDLESNI